MKIRVELTKYEEHLVRDGFNEKYQKIFDETVHTLSYDEIPELLKLGKKAQRRRAWGNLLDKWEGVIIWVVILGGIIGWIAYKNHQEPARYDNTNPSSYSTPSEGKSSISHEEVCHITTCNDGSCSESTGRGTCSWHGGVAY